MADEDDPPIPDKLYFRIGELAEIVGVEPHVLRYWEQEFRIRPERSPSGQRMYKRRDIGRFLAIRRLLHTQGFTIAGARRALRGRSGAPSAASPVVDVAQLEAARKELEQLGSRIARMRRRVRRAWAPYVVHDEGSDG
ncbi:MAG: MerR family transcriptional regulator [Alphaproteobacteria bacterium]|nr:MerR family transcriptional regulator [Alphaproteobacteria bacterium]